MLNQKTVSRLQSEIAGQVRFDEPMCAHTSFRIGGPADALVVPSDTEDIFITDAPMREIERPFFIIS